LLLFRGNERIWRRRSARGRWPAQQSGGEFSSAVSPTRAGDAAVSKYEDAAEIQFSSRPGPESFQSRAASYHPAGLQAEALDCIGGVARTSRVGRLLRAGVSSSTSVNPVTLTTPGSGLSKEGSPWPSTAPTTCILIPVVEVVDQRTPPGGIATSNGTTFDLGVSQV
jgi:hypothetical protein